MNTPAPLPLNRKAMLVRLRISKPRLSHRLDAATEQHIQADLGDAGIKAFASIFLRKDNPVRLHVNLTNEAYAFHKSATVPYTDRGPRLLPVARYEFYRDKMAKLLLTIEKSMAALLPNYDGYVQQDIDERNRDAVINAKPPRAKLSDYPTKDQFERQFKLELSFAPLPEENHWLFDPSQTENEEMATELRRQFAEAQAQVEETVKAELMERMRAPLVKLMGKLAIPAGEDGAIFRDSAVENVKEAVLQARALAMGDAEVLAACDAVEASLTGHASKPQVLRDSPAVRAQTAEKLKNVASRLGWVMEAMAASQQASEEVV